MGIFFSLMGDYIVKASEEDFMLHTPIAING